MSFHEVRFPDNIDYGSSGGPGYFTNIIVNDAGAEERVPRWQSAKRKYDVGYGIKHPADLNAVYRFYIARMGPAFGFRYKDWIDYATTPSGNTHVPNKSNIIETVNPQDVDIGTGDGAATRFQLVKRYLSGGIERIRTITKPVEGTVRVAVDGTEVITGWTVDTTSGGVLFTTAPVSGAAITAGFEFDVPVRFGKEVDEDALRASLDDFGYGKVESFPLVELSDGIAVADDAYCGGAIEVCLKDEYQLSAGYARGYVFETAGTGLGVRLPDANSIPPGGPIFWILNLGPATTTLKLFDGTTYKAMASGVAYMIMLAADGAGDNHWYIL